MHDRVLAYVARTLADAHLIRGFLEGAEIECEIRNEHLIGGMGELPITTDTLPQVWVAGTDLDRARRYIHQALDGGEPDTWTCSECGERLEGQFSECWSCGTERTAQP